MISIVISRRQDNYGREFIYMVNVKPEKAVVYFWKILLVDGIIKAAKMMRCDARRESDLYLNFLAEIYHGHNPEPPARLSPGDNWKWKYSLANMVYKGRTL